MIKKLKRAVDWMFTNKWVNITLSHDADTDEDTIFVDGKLFNPHEETGRHWLVEMLRKLNDIQFDRWKKLMYESEKIEDYIPNDAIFRWYLTAPSELCFEKIMEVISEVK